jgi:hypothetical protein
MRYLAFFLLVLSGAGRRGPAARRPGPLTLRQGSGTCPNSGAYANRAAAGESKARSGAALAPLEGILRDRPVRRRVLPAPPTPSARSDFTLRQRAVTPAILRSRRPQRPARHRQHDDRRCSRAAAAQCLSRGGGGRRQSTLAKRPAQQNSGPGTVTAVEVARGYWGGVLATERVRTLEAALVAARSHQREA